MTLLDNFTRANENPLSNGGQWGGDILGRASHALEVLSNQCVGANAGAGNSGSAYWLTMPNSADQSCSIVIGSGTGPNLYYQLFVRLVSIGASFNSYALLAIGGTSDISIYRYDGGSGTVLLDTGVGVNSGDTLELRATGTSIAVYKNSVFVDSVADATYSANGFIGLLLGPGAGVADAKVTSFSGTTFGAAPVNSVAPVVSGTPTVGQALATTNGTWTNTPTGYTYQWRRDNTGGGTYSNIASATASSYTLVDADDACNIRCVVTATNAVGSTPANSNAVGTVVEPLPANTVAPLVTGSTPVGSVLICTQGTWSHMGGHTPSYAYQWTRNGTNIAAATLSTYTTQAADAGKVIGCKVTATNTGGSSSPQASSNTVTVDGGGAAIGWSGGFQSGFTG